MGSRKKNKRRKNNSTRKNTVQYNKNLNTTKRSNSNSANIYRDIPSDVTSTNRATSSNRRKNVAKSGIFSKTGIKRRNSSGRISNRNSSTISKTSGPIRSGSELKNVRKKKRK